MPDKFDPGVHMMKLKGKDYLETKWRLLWLRTEHPEATIATDCLAHEKDFALFKATVAIPNCGTATGHGSETKADFGDFIEKAETKALGRALAALGYGTQFCEDFDTERLVDSPVDRAGPQQARTAAKPAPAPQTTGQPVKAPAEKINEEQLKRIKELVAAKLAITVEDYDKARLKAKHPKVADLSHEQAAKLILDLQAKPDKEAKSV